MLMDTTKSSETYFIKKKERRRQLFHIFLETTERMKSLIFKRWCSWSDAYFTQPSSYQEQQENIAFGFKI